MANKKSLKRTINLICEDLLVECIAASLYGNNRDCAESLIYSTIKLQRDFISRISHPEPGMPQKKYFKVLKGEFVAHVGDIIDQINQ